MSDCTFGYWLGAFMGFVGGWVLRTITGHWPGPKAIRR